MVSPKFDIAQDHHELLRQRWVDLITGHSRVDPTLPVFQAAITAQDAACDSILDRAETAPTRSQIFVDNPLGDEALMTVSFDRLLVLSKAWITPGSRFYQAPKVKAFVLDALRDMNRIAYHAERDKPGNWWEWEIGSSNALADTLAIFHDHIAPQDFQAYTDAIEYFVPDPWTQQGGAVSTGANRVDLCRATIVSSILTGDEVRLRHAVEGLPETWQWVKSGDGFYRDGSFVQHLRVPYTGTYGMVLLSGISLLFALLTGTEFDIAAEKRSGIYDAVEATYAPFIYRGQMMDAVRGRAVSREDERSRYHGDEAIEAILRLSLAVDAPTATRWRELCRGWIEDAHAGAAKHDVLAEASIVRTALVHDLMTSDASPVPEGELGRLFPSMDRLVHRGRGGAWVFAIAMCSRRITWYECGNGENDFGAQTGSGMTYLYLDSADDHFDDEFWPTADLAAPPGTTVDAVHLPPQVEGQWGKRCPWNEWTGGSVLEEWSLAGQHLIGPGATGLTARKTWFAGPEYVMCLGADITSSAASDADQSAAPADDGHSADGCAKTVVEHRNTGVVSPKLVADGSPITRATLLKSPRWAHLDGTAGYVFLADATVSASVAERSGSWERINSGGSSTLHTRYYATIEVKHSGSEAGDYAYLVLPSASEEVTRQAAATPPVNVIANTAEVQAVVAGETTAANFWRAGSAAGITVDRPASVLVKRTPGGATIAVSDPTQAADRLTVELDDLVVSRISGEDVVLSTEGGVTQLVIDTQGRGGRPVTAQLHSE